MSKGIERIMELVVEIENENIENENVKELINEIKEYFENKRKNSLENGRLKEMLDILENSKNGISKNDIMERMGISKGNFGSLIMGLRKKNVEVIRVGNVYILEKYVRVGIDNE